MLAASALAVGVAVACAGFFAFGFAVGLRADFKLAKEYKQNAAIAVARAAESARREILEQANMARQKKSEIEKDPSRMLNVHEAEESFEKSLAAIYPDDPSLQDAVRKEREARKSIPK